MIATALRFNEENAGRTLLVAGHTDTSADVAFNQKLSEERAEVALALLEGGANGRQRFASLCDGRHTIGDIKQILNFISKTMAGFDCDPGPIDETPVDAAVHKFQTAYNANQATLSPDPSIDPLTVDGSVGPLTWGAFFDCYEAGLRDELGEDAAGVSALRSKLRFSDDRHRFLGFSEHFPIEELGVDNFRSQTNRRVELVFFEAGEDPELDHAALDPATSELYLPGQYEREPIADLGSARRRTLTVNVIDHQGFPVENQGVTLFLPDGRTLEVPTDSSGTFSAKVPLGVVSMLLEDGRFLTFGTEYAPYQHDPVNELQTFPDDSEGSLNGNDSRVSNVDDHNDSMTRLSSFDGDLAPLP